ncbi:bcl-2-modifying factor-like [Scyliorhinus canicula]|uniref:bcl-2-modifying factor-like n=1 Tax=Scyliorhinus canicula TaxID=7830 RepID=UPI0018F5465C|nr:bcl-2-modifying factor-like [Scyliorhinus canicula]XP_038640040.1 bcl-2-modifying factor-like [Scyliorhinus canicula]
MDLSEAEELDSDDEVFDQDLTAPDSGYSDTSGTYAPGASPTWTSQRQRLFSPTQSMHIYGAGCSQEEPCDRATQTSSSTPPSIHPESANPMLPSGVGSEPQRLFYGNAGYRLHFTEVFEVPRASTTSRHGRMDGLPMDLQPEERVEIRIGQKLQQIGDQFHSSYMERHNRNENHIDHPFWWRLLLLLFTLIFDPEENVEPAGQR